MRDLHPGSDDSSLDELATRLRRARPAPELWRRLEAEIRRTPPHATTSKTPTPGFPTLLRIAAAAALIATAWAMLAIPKRDAIATRSLLLTAHEAGDIERDQRGLDRDLRALLEQDAARRSAACEDAAPWAARSDRNLDRCRRLAAENPRSRSVRDSLYRATARRVEELRETLRFASDEDLER